MMFDIQAMAFGIIGTAVLIGIGIVILYQFMGTQAGCAGTLDGSPIYNASQDYCWNGTNSATPTGTAYADVKTMSGYLGTSSGGLVTWIPIIIVITIGFGVFSGFFGGGKKRRY